MNKTIDRSKNNNAKTNLDAMDQASSGLRDRVEVVELHLWQTEAVRRSDGHNRSVTHTEIAAVSDCGKGTKDMQR